MKNISLVIIAILSLCTVFVSCSKSRSYAEKLADERKAINRFIKSRDIKVITEEEFKNQGYITNLDENEYVELQNKVYLQIVDKGDTDPIDSIKNGDQLTVRFEEYNIQEGYVTSLSNIDDPYAVDAFNYRISGNEISGEFYGDSPMLSSSINITKVPVGWLIGLRYVGYGSRIKVIVPSKMGHIYALNGVYPCFYDLRRLALADPTE